MASETQMTPTRCDTERVSPRSAQRRDRERPSIREQVQAIRRVQVAVGRPLRVRVPVLPDDLVARNADQDDAMAVIVVDCDQAGTKPERERGMVELAWAGCRAVTPEDMPMRGHDQHVAG